jgi:hypothetical protein
VGGWQSEPPSVLAPRKPPTNEHATQHAHYILINYFIYIHQESEERNLFERVSQAKEFYFIKDFNLRFTGEERL